MTRNLDTLIKEFNQATIIDKDSRLATGKELWIEVDGIPTCLIDIFVAGLLPQEREMFETVSLNTS